MNDLELKNELKLYKRSLRGKAENTKDSYSYDIKQFIGWMEEFEVEYIFEKEVTLDELDDIFQDYKDFLFSNYENVKTINRKCNAVNAYLKFKQLNYKVENEKIQGQTFLDDMLTNEELMEVAQLAKDKGDLRTYAIVAGIYFTGARVSEILQLKVTDLTKDEVMIKGKGSKHRKILIPDKLKEIFDNYYKNGRLDRETKNLFTSQRGALTRKGVNPSLDKYAIKIGVDIKQKLHPHAIRHLFTKNLMDKNVSYSAIKQLLGHALTTTDIYAQLSKRELLEKINSLEFI